MELEEEWSKEIEKLEKEEKEYDEIYKKQLYGVRLVFNEKVKDLLRYLGFDKNFHNVFIEDNRLVVYKTKTDNQPLNTLSTSERYSLALLIMLAAREIYIPEFPIFALDEILISFLEERGKKILDYIKEQVPYVVCTMLRETTELEVEYA